MNWTKTAYGFDSGDYGWSIVRNNGSWILERMGVVVYIFNKLASAKKVAQLMEEG